MKRHAIGALALLLAGCSFSNHSYIMSQIANLPNGDQINIGGDVYRELGKPDQSRRFASWRRDGRYKELALQMPAEWQVEDQFHELHLSPDGNRAWFTRSGQTIASFDYEAGKAVVGATGQPEWAVK